MPYIISRKGYRLVEDCGSSQAFMIITETHDLKSIDLVYSDNNWLNDMLLSNMSYFQTLYENKF